MPFTRTPPRGTRWFDASIVALALASVLVVSPAAAQQDTVGRGRDPRVGLGGGFQDAKDASKNMRLVGHGAKASGWFNPQDLGDLGFANSDLAFRGTLVFQGGRRGWNVWDVSDPAAPRIRAQHLCQGGEGDPSVYGNLLFISVEDLGGRVDCGIEGVPDSVSVQRFRGVRIFDISNLDRPQQIAAVQTCRGSHTHTLVNDPKDPANLYVYVQGTGPVRWADELKGCIASPDDLMSSLFRIEVIRVPLAAPENARIVNAPRLFADASGRIAGLWPGGGHGTGFQETGRTDQCHDITAYPAIGLAAGACSGNGILLDISNPALPKRIDQVIDKNFAYWHSATFNNSGTSIVFTDEWGGGTAARCRDTDKMSWGADAIFTLGADRKMQMAGYYKMPAPQTATENCVAHNGGLIPVPGRDILVQAWYQGGISVVDFTNPAKPVEIAYFDRGPIADKLAFAGFWSSYWYNGHIYASEIGRGLDVFELMPSEFLTQNELDAAKSVRTDGLNPQLQQQIRWPASYPVARSYLDQLTRGQGLAAARLTTIDGQLSAAQYLPGSAQVAALTKLATELDADARRAADATRVRLLAAVLRDIARAAQ